MTPKTVDSLRHCTNSGSTPFLFFLPQSRQQIKFLNDEHTTSLYSDRVPEIFPELQNNFSEYFAKGLQKCKILSPYLCKDVENFDDLGCPKDSKLLENDDAEWNCSNYAYRHKKTLHCAEKKAYVYGIWPLNFCDNI